MNEQLKRSYDLIKQGEQQAAIDIIEPIIRAERDNEDAWWLLANATSDTEAKRNALNTVIRLTSNETRKEKAQTLLQQLDDPFDFDIEPASKPVGMSEYIALDETPKKETRGRFNCATISLIIVGLIGACGLFACFGIYLAAGDLFSFINLPNTYDDRGILEDNGNYSDELTPSDPTDGYFYEGSAGEEISIRVDSESETAPFIVIYEVDSGILVAISQTTSFDGTANLSYRIVDDGGYLVTVRGAEILSTELGYGEYTLEFESQ